MAFSIFLNFERLSMKIIEAEITQMTDDNVVGAGGEIDEVDNQKFENNLYHGSIAITFITNLYETALNTILNRRLDCSESEILKLGHEGKLRIICAMCKAELTSIKGDNSYGIIRDAVKLRNDITHYKDNMIAEGHFINIRTSFPMGSAKTPVASLFTKSYMQKCYDGTIKFLELLCKKCGYVLCLDCEVIDCDGRDDTCEFILTGNAKRS